METKGPARTAQGSCVAGRSSPGFSMPRLMALKNQRAAWGWGQQREDAILSQAFLGVHCPHPSPTPIRRPPQQPHAFAAAQATGQYSKKAST
jgi:hypothetical protein